MNMSYEVRQAFRRRVLRGFTLIEILGFIVFVVCVIYGAKLGQHIAESWYGGLLGGVLGALAFIACGLALAGVKDLWKGWGLPMCRNGCCRGPGYFSGYGDYDIQKSGREYYKVCKCGDRYKRRGNRFVLVNKDSTETPYLIWRPFRGWFLDKENHT
jgi:hypothetical protein